MTHVTKYSNKTGLELEIEQVILKYKDSYDNTKLIEVVVKTTFETLGIDNTIKVDYVDSYCDLFIEYAKKHQNANGFWGRYKIDEGVKAEWTEKHPRFRQTISLIPNITIDVLNQSLDHVINMTTNSGDIKTITQIVLKMMDNAYKTDKDSGLIKDRGYEAKQAKKRASTIIDDEELKEAEEFLHANSH